MDDLNLKSVEKELDKVNHEGVSTSNKTKEATKSEVKMVPDDDDDALAIIDFDPTDPYKSEYSFTFRIYYGIERFRKATTLPSHENTLFQCYLTHCGVDSKQKAIIKEKQIDPITDKEIDIGVMIEDDHRPVDFLYSIHNFFDDYMVRSPHFTQMVYYERAAPIIRQFLQFLLKNKVCPEYDQDIKESVELCNRVEVELPLLKKLSYHLPDKVNKAHSLLFEGSWSFMMDGSEEASGYHWNDDKTTLQKTIGFDLETAKSIANYENRKDLALEKKLMLQMSIISIDRENSRIYLKEHCEGYQPLEFNIKADSDVLDLCMEGFLLDGEYIQLNDNSWYMDQMFFVLPPFSYQNVPQ